MNRLLSKLGRLLKTRSQRIAAVLMVAVLAYVLNQAGGPRFEHHVTVLGSLPDFAGSVESPDFRDHDNVFVTIREVAASGGCHLTWLHKEGGKVRLVMDCVAGPSFDSIDFQDIVFSSDGNHLAYTGKIDDKMQAVIDGIPGLLFDQVGRVEFIPQTDHAIYSATTDAKGVTVIDGQTLPQPEGSFEFSPDYKHLVSFSWVGKQQQIVLDGQPGPLFDSIRMDSGSWPTFSPDSQHLAYVAGKNYRGWELSMVWDGQPGPNRLTPRLDAPGFQLILDGQPGPWFHQILKVSFTADSRHLVYLTTEITGQKQMVLDGAPGPEYDDIPDGFDEISPVGAHFEYVGEKGGKQQVVADGVPGLWYDEICGRPGYSQAGLLAYVAKVGGKALVVLNGVPGPGYDEIGDSGSGAGNGEFEFSSDGKHLAYEARAGTQWRVVVDGVPGPVFDRIGEKELRRGSNEVYYEPGHIFFSGQGNHLGYVAKSGDKYHAVVDGVPGPPFDKIYYFIGPSGYDTGVGFSPDGQHTVYMGANETRTGWQSFTRWLRTLFTPFRQDEDAGMAQFMVDGSVLRSSPFNINKFSFSPDSQHYAFIAPDANDGPWRVYVDNVRGPAFKQIRLGPVWRADGQLEYLAIQKNGENAELVRVVVSGFGPTKP